MKTHLDVSYLGLVPSFVGRREEKIEIESGIRVGEILRLPAEDTTPLLHRALTKVAAGSVHCR
jgi:hypothetical protein